MADALLALFFPPLCFLCEEPIGGRGPEVCARCRAAFRRLKPPFCARCGSPGAKAGPACRVCREWKALQGARSALLFAGSVQSWIHQVKYRGVTGLAPLAGAPLETCFREAPACWQEAAALVPVPLHAARRRERGFNQAELLATELARRIGVPSLPVLERWKPTLPQVGLAAFERGANVRGAFRVGSSFAALCRRRSFVLVDDVLTTGSTLEAAAAALVDAGGGPVYALTLARALPGRES